MVVAVIREDHFVGTGSTEKQNQTWYEEELDDDLKLSYSINSVLDRGKSKYHDIALLDTKHFGKALFIDGKMQSSEMDEFIYHECLIHPALLCHTNPKSVFIMGGGEGSAAREALKHTSLERVVFCDMDEELVDFCRRHLTANSEAFANEKLRVVIGDDKAVLRQKREIYDIIVGDLPDPKERGSDFEQPTGYFFYQTVVKPSLKRDGIFVTQAGPAGVLTHKKTFSAVYKTLNLAFKYVVAYTAHVPSFSDTWGWVMASDLPFPLNLQLINKRIEERINGELLYLNGESLLSSTVMNKTVHRSLFEES